MSFLDELKKRKLNQSKDFKKDFDNIDKSSDTNTLNKNSFINQTSKLRNNLSNLKINSKKIIFNDKTRIDNFQKNIEKEIIPKNNFMDNKNDNRIVNKIDNKIEEKTSKTLKINKKNTKNKKDKKELLSNLKERIIFILKPEFEKSKITKTDINKIFLNVKKEIGIYKKRVKKEKKSVKTDDSNLNQEEIERIMSESKNMGLEHEIVSNLFFKLGMKLFEIAQLRVEDINFNNGKIKFKDKIFDMDSGTAAKLLAYIGSRETGILVSKNNQSLSKDEILAFIKKIMDAAHVQKKENIESLVEKFQNSLRKEGKPYMYWDYIDQVVELRTRSIKKVEN